MHLRHSLTCLFFLLTAAFSSYSQAVNDPRIQHIRDLFQHINKDSTLRPVEVGLEEYMEEYPDNGGFLVGYFRKDTLIKMILNVGPSYGMVQRDYYFSDNKPVFIYEWEKHFRTTTEGLDHTKLILNFEGRYYLDKGQVISKIIKGEPRFADSITDDHVKQLLNIRDEIKALRKKVK